jgi:predicted transcriptional regulator
MKPDKNGRLMTMTEREFKRLFDKHTQVELARLLGVSQPDVSYWAKKFGLCRGNGKKLNITEDKK